MARFVADNIDTFEASDPKLPECAFNRLADNWRPLFASAEILLADLKQKFTDDRIFSKDLVELLAQMKERLWPEVCRGKPITERWLARQLVMKFVCKKVGGVVCCGVEGIVVGGVFVMAVEVLWDLGESEMGFVV